MKYGYGIVDKNNCPYTSESCVCEDDGPLYDEVYILNDHDNDDDPRIPYRVVELHFDVPDPNDIQQKLVELDHCKAIANSAEDNERNHLLTIERLRHENREIQARYNDVHSECCVQGLRAEAAERERDELESLLSIEQATNEAHCSVISSWESGQEATLHRQAYETLYQSRLDNHLRLCAVMLELDDMKARLDVEIATTDEMGKRAGVAERERDELKSEVATLHQLHLSRTKLTTSAINRAEAAEKKVAELQKDAARYRYMRSHFDYSGLQLHRLEWHLPRVVKGPSLEIQLDESIDENIAADSEVKS